MPLPRQRRHEFSQQPAGAGLRQPPDAAASAAYAGASAIAKDSYFAARLSLQPRRQPPRRHAPAAYQPHYIEPLAALLAIVIIIASLPDAGHQID